MLVVAAFGDGEEGFLEAAGHRASGALADGAVIDLADRGDLGGGAGEEDLVGDVELVAGDRLLANIDPLLAQEVDRGGAGDAGEDRGRSRRGADDAAFDDED